jgi:hypothetical protein
VTFTAVGSLQGAENAVSGTSTTFSLTTTTAGDFILAEITNDNYNAAGPEQTSNVTSSRVTWNQITGNILLPISGASYYGSVWLGQVNSAGSDTVTVTYASSMGGNNSRFDAREFHSTVVAVPYLDTHGSIARTTGAASWATLTPAGSGELYWGWCENSGSEAAGSTSGFVYEGDAHGNGEGYCLSVSAAYTPVWGDSGQVAGIMVLMTETLPATAGRSLIVPQAVKRSYYW